MRSWTDRNVFAYLSGAFALALSVLVISALLIHPTMLQAQGGEGTITGTVNDSTGAVIPGATITLTNAATQEKRVSQSNGSGFFSFTAVPPGTYSLAIEMKGFNTHRRTNITVHPSDQIGLSGLVLKPGATSTTVEVSSTAVDVVPVDTGEKSDVITSSQIQNTSVVGRNAVELLKILPGVVANTAQNGNPLPSYNGEVAAFNRGIGEYHIDGTRSDALAIINDGADTIDPGCNCGNVVTPNIDMIAEVKVQTANFSAENAKGPVVISSVDKSGGAQFHGEAYYSLRSHQFNANDWQNNFNSIARPNNKFQYPGFNIGGPVLLPWTDFNKHHDKMFFFAAFEWQRQGVDKGLKRAIVPTADMRVGDFSKIVNGAPSFSDSTINTDDYWKYQHKIGATTSNQIPYLPQTATAPTVFSLYDTAIAPCVPASDGGFWYGAPYNSVNDPTPPGPLKDSSGNVVKDKNGNTVITDANPFDSTLTPMQCTGAYSMAASAIDPAFQGLMNLYPLPNADPNRTQGFNYVGDIINPQNRTQQLVRIDYNFNQNTKLYSRLNHEGEREPYPYGLWWDPSIVPYPSNAIGENKSYSWSSSFTQVLDPTLTNEMVLAISRLDLPNVLADPKKVSRSGLALPQGGTADFNHYLYVPGEDQIPSVTDWSGGQADMIQPGGFNPVLFANKWLNSFTDNLSKVAGTHLIKMGAYYEHLTNDQPTSSEDQGFVSNTQWGGFSTGNSYSDMLLGIVGDYSQTTQNLVGNMAENELEAYFQDSWKMKSRFTLDYGVRFYHEGWMYDKHGRIGTFEADKYWQDLAAARPFPGIRSAITDPTVPRSGFTTPYGRWAPHFGFAYDVTGKATTVIRGGFGTYYYRDQGNVFFGAIANPPFFFSTDVCCGKNMADIDAMRGSPSTATGLSTLDMADKHVPVTYSYSLTLSKKLPFSSVAELSYVGNSSHNQVQPSGYNINVVPEGAELGISNPGTDTDKLFRPFSQYQTISQVAHVLTQHYDSLQATWSKQTGKVNYAASYQFGKALGTGGDYYSGATSVDPFNARGRSYGLLPYDRTHQFKIAYNIYVPNIGTLYLGNNSVANGILNGWQVNGITQWESGGPINYFNFGGLGDSRIIAGTPDTVVRPLLTCNPAQNLGPQQIFNATCFKAPSPGINGVYQFPYIHGPGFNQSDLSAFKNFQIGKTESRRLQVRAEAFNFLNHPLWGFQCGSGNCSDPGVQLSFNGYGSSVDPKAIQTNHIGYMTNKFGHRIIQLAVKFFF